MMVQKVRTGKGQLAAGSLQLDYLIAIWVLWIWTASLKLGTTLHIDSNGKT
jgi:hypothetical protein